MRSGIALRCTAVVCAACTEAAAPPVSSGVEISAWAGGSVSFETEVTLHVPAGSLARDTTIEIARLPVIPEVAADGFVAFGQGYELSPHGTAFSLGQPARITMVVDSQALAARGLEARTVQLFHFDEAAQRYVNVAGTLDERGVLVASIEHFSKYVVMAQGSVVGAPGPLVTMQAPVPDPIRAGSPIYLRATVLPSSGTAIAAVRVFYRKLQPTPQAYQVGVMVPDSSPVTPGANTYGFLVPGSGLRAIDLAMGDDFEYYAEATDTLGVTRSLVATPVRQDVTRSYAAGSVAVVPAALDISAGFEKWLPVMAVDSAAIAYQIVPEAVSVTSCPAPAAAPLGSADDQRASGVHFRALTACAGTLSVSASGETEQVPVTVRNGHLASIALFRYEQMGGTEVRTRFDGPYALPEGHTLELDAQGSDGYGNTINVNVTWEADATIGSIDAGGQLYTLDGAGFGKVTASVGGFGGVSAVQWFNAVGRSWAPRSGVLNVGSPATWAANRLGPSVPIPGLRTTRLLNDSVLLTGKGRVQAYRPSTSTWDFDSMQNLARREQGAILLPSGQVLTSGGTNGVNAVADVEIYNPVTRGWRPVVSMGWARVGHQQLLLPGGKVLAIGGADTAALASAEVYDPIVDAWTAVAPMKVARRDHAATVISGGKVLVSGGQNPTVLASVELHDVATGQWTDALPMATARRSHTQTVLATGKVLVAGGTGGTAVLASAELYDPATGLWTSAGSMTAARTLHSATLLADGNVLVVGGNGTGTAELYNPATNAWTAVASMATARIDHSATLLSSGRVMVTGVPGGSTEVYLPSQPAPQPALAASGTGLYVAWHEPNAIANRVYVKQWTGTAWTQVGASFVNDPDREASWPRIAVNPVTGAPYVVWQEQSPTAGTQIQVKRWDGMSWVQDVSGSLNVDATRSAAAPVIAFSGATPHVAWQEASATGSQIYVRRWSGTGWTQLGGSLNRDPAQSAAAPAIAIAGATPYVAWQEATADGQRVHVSHWDGAVWVADGGGLNLDAADIAAAPALMIQGTVPYASWRETVGTATQIHVAHWTGTAWLQDRPSLSDDPAHAIGAPAIAAYNGTPYVAWRETRNGASQVFVKHRGPTGWLQNGGSLNTNIGRDAFRPSLVLVGATPFVAWAESNGLTYSVYVKALE